MEQTLTGSTSSFNSGSGHSWADIDGDGDMDLFLNGSARLWINKALDGGTFQNGQSLIPGGVAGSGWSACFGDFDNDGDPDVHGGNSGTDFLLENRWPLPFVNMASQLQLTDPDWNQSVCWADYNNDGLLDIYITHELPDGDGPHEFYENDYPNPFIPRFPQGGEEDTFGLADKNSHAYGLTWADIDLDGDVDAVTSACGSSGTIPGENPHNKIYRNKHPQMGFEDMSLATGLVDGAEVSNGSASYWAMLFDYDGDQFPDLSIGKTNGAHRLWRNAGSVEGDFLLDLVPNATHNTAGGGAFVDGAVAGDWDNDGDMDIYTTPDGLYVNNGDGSYTKRNDLVPGGGSDASFVDFNNDGNLDVFNFGDLWLNPGGYGNHWISVELEGSPGTGTTRSAHHVKISVTAGGKTYYREHRYQVGSYSQHMMPTHFGLGSATTIDELRIEWRNGFESVYNDLDVDRYIFISQNANCGDDLEIITEIARFCPGGSVDLAAVDHSERPNDYAWHILSGPSNDIEQFGDPSALETTFTPKAAGAYKLGLTYYGCPNGVVMELFDSDFNGNGTYDEEDMMICLSHWQQNQDVLLYDMDADGIVSILDALNLCEEPGLAQKIASH
jgi:hypothetical protein